MKSIKELAEAFKLDESFVSHLNDIIVDKSTLDDAVEMFDKGLLPYDVATGNDPVDVAELHKTVEANFKARLEHERAIAQYYTDCPYLKLTHFVKGERHLETVFVKDGKVVAFSHVERGQGGIYMANNEVMPDFRWNPHQALARLRSIDRAFYRQVKKAAYDEPKELFDFSQRTVIKNK